MKRSEFKSKLASYLIKRDQHLALNLVQAEQLTEYILEFCDSISMLPPDTLPAALSLSTKDWKVSRELYIENRFKWEPEDEA